MLEGICPEAVEILKDMPCPAGTFDILRRMAPMRQMEAAELMTGQSNYTATFAKAILAATTEAQLVDPRKRSEEHTSELQSLMRISYAVFCLKKNITRTSL